VAPATVRLLLCFFALFLASARAIACPAGNLLEDRAVTSSRGVERPALLTDGVLTVDGDDAKSPVGAAMSGLRPYAEWDLGEPTTLVAAAVQADNNDVYRLTTSLDGHAYEPAWVVGAVADAGLRERLTRELHVVARFVRFEAVSGDSVKAATEVRVYCAMPAQWPPSRLVRDQEPEDPANVRGWQFQSLKLVIGLLAFPLLFALVPRLGARTRRRLYAVLFVLSALSWIQFGRFNGGDPLHSWDMFHYFMGTKYFPEVGYTELYKCGAKAERENGHGAEVDSLPIRDVEDNQVYPSDWSLTDAGRCRARFSPERWTAFKADLNAFRPLFTGREIAEAFADHGFNATPIYVSWVRLFTRDATVTRAHLVWLAQLDSVALVAAVAALTWGFGPVAGIVAALTLGLGGMWSYHWVGGCLARHTWLFCAALGTALLAKERYFWGAVALSLSGLLRLFPFVFVGAVGLWVIIGAVRERRLSLPGRNFLAGTALTCVLFVSAAGAAVGFGAYPRFAHVFERHSHSAMTNQFGLTTVLSYTAGESSVEMHDPKLTNGFERWEHHYMRHRVERRPLWALGVVVSLGVIVLSVIRGASAADCVALSGLLLFSALPMTSYDYTWLALLVALGRVRPRVLPSLLAFTVFTLALFVFGGDAMETQHVLGSIGCAVLLAQLVPWRELFRMLLPPPPPPSSPEAA
jgi:hypothetical protein